MNNKRKPYMLTRTGDLLVDSSPEPRTNSKRGLDRREFLKKACAGLAMVSISKTAMAEQPTGIVMESRNRADTSSRRVLTQSQAHTLTAQGVTYDYFEVGNPNGRPLILVHGFPDSPIAWEGVLAHLDLTKLRIIAPYLRGYGRSQVQREELLTGQFAALGHDLLTLADELKLNTFVIATI